MVVGCCYGNDISRNQEITLFVQDIKLMEYYFHNVFHPDGKNKIKNSGSAESHTRTYAHTAVELVENCDCQLEYPQKIVGDSIYSAS